MAKIILILGLLWIMVACASGAAGHSYVIVNSVAASYKENVVKRSINDFLGVDVYFAIGAKHEDALKQKLVGQKVSTLLSALHDKGVKEIVTPGGDKDLIEVGFTFEFRDDAPTGLVVDYSIRAKNGIITEVRFTSAWR